MDGSGNKIKDVSHSYFILSLFEGGWQVPPSKFGISVHVQAGLDAAGDFSVKKEDQICLEQYRVTSHGLKMLYCMI